MVQAELQQVTTSSLQQNFNSEISSYFEESFDQFCCHNFSLKYENMQIHTFLFMRTGDSEHQRGSLGIDFALMNPLQRIQVI